MKITKINPTKILLEGFENKHKELKALLTYKDKTAYFAYQTHKKAHWFESKYGREAYVERLNHLKSLVEVCLLEENDKGFETLAGLWSFIKEAFPEASFVDLNTYPKPDMIAWANKPPDLRPYQVQAVENSLKNKHSALDMCTGSGKSRVILQIVKELGLRTLIVSPSVSIANQLYEDFVKYLGQNKVGLYGDGKKETKNQITIGIAQSLTKLEPKSKEYKALAEAKVFIVDEAHLVATDTQYKIALGLAQNSPYRFLVSATQFRNDGSDILLKGITGPVVFEYSLQKAVSEGYLAAPNFYIKQCQTDSLRYFKNPLQTLAEHLYKNVSVHKMAATIANTMVTKFDHKVMIMIDHLEQFALLLPYLSVKPVFAHGGTTKDNKKHLPEEYWKSDVVQIVKDFNSGQIPLLIGTSAIGMGSDTRPVNTIINLQGGQSDNKFMQLVGRGTRKVPGKVMFNFIDFDIKEPTLERWTQSRIEMYKSLFDNINHG